MIMNASVYRSENYMEQSGCIPIKIKKQSSVAVPLAQGTAAPLPNSMLSLADFQIMLVTSGTTGENWVFPKGSIKKDETKKEAAKRETMEEAGVKGKIIKNLEPILLADHNKGCNLTYFLLLVDHKKKLKKSEWEERSKRVRKWWNLATILTVIGPLKPHIETAITTLQRTIQLYQQQINIHFNLSSIPITDFHGRFIKDIERWIKGKPPKEKKDKKEKKKEKKEKKKEKKREKEIETLKNNALTTPSIVDPNLLKHNM